MQKAHWRALRADQWGDTKTVGLGNTTSFPGHLLVVVILLQRKLHVKEAQNSAPLYDLYILNLQALLNPIIITK